MPSTSLAHDSQPRSAGQEDIPRGRHRHDEDRYLNKTWHRMNHIQILKRCATQAYELNT